MAKPSLALMLLSGKRKNADDGESDDESSDEQAAIGEEILDAIKNSDGAALAEAICNLMDVHHSDSE